MTPAEGGWRVVVIDSVDDMNRHAANALLKALEEPPDRALLLLVSHNPGRVIPTIRSRCRRLTLHPLADEGVATALSRFRPDLGAEDAAVLIRLAEGSPGRALRLAAEGGLELYREMVDLLSALPALDPALLHGLSDRLARPGAEARFRTVAGLLAWWLARMIRTGARGRGAEAAGDEIVPGEAGLSERLLARGSLDQWVEVWEKISRLFARADSLDRKQVVLNAFLALANAARP
jgi:DNA polymerase-3 subunit delta'